MNKQEKLQERYEDALFAIMMDELASSLGQEAFEENERLKADPTASVPEQIEKKCLQTIRNHYRRATIKKVGRVTLGAFGKMAMIFGVACALFVGAFATSENVRIATMNLVVETFGESTDFYFAPVSDNAIPQIKAGWLPEGLELVDENKNEMSSWFICKGKDAQYIQGTYYVGDGQLVSVDTENADVSYIPLHDVEATLAIKEDKLHIVWATADKSGFIDIFAERITADDLVQVAKNIII